MDLFSKDWAEAYMKLINSDVEYKENGKGWVNPIRFVSLHEHEKKAVWLDLKNGVCEQSLCGKAALAANSSYEIQAENKAWKSLLETKGDPLVALFTGKLKLTKGSLFTLTRFTASAKDLVRIASIVEISEMD
jgi:putative sterol carrier protein